jgi:hypothetical protein
VIELGDVVFSTRELIDEDTEFSDAVRKAVKKIAEAAEKEVEDLK